METSILIARLLGPAVLVAAIPMILSPGAIQAMGRDLLENRALLFLAGILSLVGGLAIVNVHSRWNADWTVFITLFGWAMIVGGIIRIAFPAVVIGIGGAMLGYPVATRLAGVLWLLIGALLTAKGYGIGV